MMHTQTTNLCLLKIKNGFMQFSSCSYFSTSFFLWLFRLRFYLTLSMRPIRESWHSNRWIKNSSSIGHIVLCYIVKKRAVNKLTFLIESFYVGSLNKNYGKIRRTHRKQLIGSWTKSQLVIKYLWIISWTCATFVNQGNATNLPPLQDGNYGWSSMMKKYNKGVLKS